MDSFRLFLEADFWQVVQGVEASLPDDLQKLITQYVGHPLQPQGDFGLMVHRPLEAIDDESLSRLRQAFEPVRRALRDKYGERLVLFRSHDKKDPSIGSGDRRFLSFTLDPQFAQYWTYGHAYEGVYRIEEWDGKMWWSLAAEDMMELTGNKVYAWKDKVEAQKVLKQLSGTGRKFRLIYDDEAKKMQRREAGKRHGAYVVPVDDVLWVTNRANQQEFICNNKPYAKMPFGKAKEQQV